MAEQKKKNNSTNVADRERETPRKKPVQHGKAIKTMRTYQAETMGTPPLKMILVHAANERANAATEAMTKSKKKKVLTPEEAVMKIIEHLTKIQ